MKYSKGYYYNLCEVIKNELDIYKEIASLADKKTDVLVAGDIDLLQEITEIEQNAITKLGKLEEERIKVLQKVAEILEIETDKITAKYLLEHILDEELKNLLSKMYDEMKQTLKKIDKRNKINEDLIRSALEYVDFSINLLTDVGETKTNYGSDGHNTQKTFHFIDKKA